MTFRMVSGSWWLRPLNYQAKWVRRHRDWLMVLRAVRAWPKGLKAGGWR